MSEREKLRQLIEEAAEVLDRLVRRFDKYNQIELKDKTEQLRASAQKLNEQLVHISRLNLKFCTREELRLADDIVFQLSVLDDICKGYLEGI